MRNALKKLYLNLRASALKMFSVFIADKVRPDFTSQNIGKILFVRTDRIGDMVLSTPSFRALKTAFPNSELTVLASPENRGLLSNNPYADHVLLYDRNKALSERVRILLKLRKVGFDLAVDPCTDYRLGTAFMAFLTGARTRLGFSSYGREAFLNLNAHCSDKSEHFVDLTLKVLEPLGVKSERRTPELYLSAHEEKWSKSWLEDCGLGKNPIIGMHPGAHYPSQRWPTNKFARLADRLGNHGDLDLLILGGLADKHLIGEITDMAQTDVRTYVAEDLRQLVAFVSCLDVLICNNSGPLHVAAALGTPTISFMGPTDQKRWMPLGKMHRVLRIDHLPCIGCNMGRCKMKNHYCMTLITIKMVAEALREFRLTRSEAVFTAKTQRTQRRISFSLSAVSC
jgi:lipopolysaccharide heptosyltransferase II